MQRIETTWRRSNISVDRHSTTFTLVLQDKTRGQRKNEEIHDLPELLKVSQRLLIHARDSTTQTITTVFQQQTTFVTAT